MVATRSKRLRASSRRLDWGHFSFFLSIARTGTLAAAARELGVDQATVGRRLTRLEASAEARLFDRTPEGYQTTAAGRQMLATLESIEDDVLAMQRKLSGEDARLEGRVRIAAGEPFATEFLIPRLAALRTLHPGIALEIVTADRSHDLSRREADLAVRMGRRPKQPNLVVQRLTEVAVAPYASASYLTAHGVPRRHADLSEHAVIRYGGELVGLAGNAWLDKAARTAQTSLTATSILAVLAAVRAGLGIGMLSCYLADGDIGLRRLPAGIVERSDLFTVVHVDVRGNARVRAVLDALSDVIEKDRSLFEGAQ
jgi:DNA-binding transcriptional LysR family regulator